MFEEWAGRVVGLGHRHVHFKFCEQQGGRHCAEHKAVDTARPAIPDKISSDTFSDNSSLTFASSAVTRFERNRARAVFASSEADARGARSTFQARLDDMGAASIMMATSDLSRTTSETCYQGGKHREHALGWVLDGWDGCMGWVGWMDGWAGRAVVTANVGLHAGRWTPRTTLFTLADADYVESFIVQWRQRVNESISYRPA